MARNEEKAQAMLNRWHRMKRMLNQKPQEERPQSIQSTNSIAECERWRTDIVREIGDKVSEIQNAGLGEYKIRNLNDEINNLLKEKRQWDQRIKELGGPDYTKLEAKLFDHSGVEQPGSGEYKYFGAAKDLPGVRDLFFREAPQPPKRHRKDLYRFVDYEYYGFIYKGEFLGKEFEENEEEYELYERKKEVDSWIEKNKQLLGEQISNFEELDESEIYEKLSSKQFYKNMYAMDIEGKDTEIDYNDQKFKMFNVVTKKDKNEDAIEKKKKELMEKWVKEGENTEEDNIATFINQNIGL